MQNEGRKAGTTNLNLEARGGKKKSTPEKCLVPRSGNGRQRNGVQPETIGEVVSGPECLADSCWQPMPRRGATKSLIDSFSSKLGSPLRIDDEKNLSIAMLRTGDVRFERYHKMPAQRWQHRVLRFLKVIASHTEKGRVFGIVSFGWGDPEYVIRKLAHDFPVPFNTDLC